jgi:hypothetical protein
MNKRKDYIGTGWCPPVISWFINPMNTIVISAINHSEMGVMFTNLANELGHHLVANGWISVGLADLESPEKPSGNFTWLQIGDSPLPHLAWFPKNRIGELLGGSSHES